MTDQQIFRKFLGSYKCSFCVTWTHEPLYHPPRPYACLKDILSSDLACHMLLAVCLFGRGLNVCAKPEKLKPSRNTIGI